MTNEEAIETLENYHLWTGEPRELIDVRKANKALNIAIDAIKKLSEIEDIITCPLPIQEDVLRYKAICNVIKPVKKSNFQEKARMTMRESCYLDQGITQC